MCQKIIYPTKRIVVEVIKANLKRGIKFSSYWCEECVGYHMTTQKDKKMKKLPPMKKIKHCKTDMEVRVPDPKKQNKTIKKKITTTIH